MCDLQHRHLNEGSSRQQQRLMVDFFSLVVRGADHTTFGRITFGVLRAFAVRVRAEDTFSRTLSNGKRNCCVVDPMLMVCVSPFQPAYFWYSFFHLVFSFRTFCPTQATFRTFCPIQPCMASLLLYIVALPLQMLLLKLVHISLGCKS